MADITQMENRLYGAYWDDGVFDLLCGVYLLLVGMVWWMGLPYLIGFSVLIVVPWFPLRRAIVEPRAGYVEFSRKRKSRNLKVLAVGYLVFTCAAYLAVTGGAYVWKLDEGVLLGSFINGVPGALMAILALFSGWLILARRFYVYALLLVISSVLTGFMQWPPHIPFLVVGIVVLVAAITRLRRFVEEADAFAEVAPGEVTALDGAKMDVIDKAGVPE